MGAYKCNVVAEIKMGAYIHGWLFCVGAYHPDFTVLLCNVNPIMAVHYYGATVPQQSVLTLNSNMENQFVESCFYNLH